MPRIPKMLLVVICSMLTALSIRAADVHGASPFKVVNKFPLAGEGRWDYLIVDNQSRRLFLSRTNHVAVLNADSGQSIGEVADTPGVHGIALAPELGVGFVSDGGENKVTVFDLQTPLIPCLTPGVHFRFTSHSPSPPPFCKIRGAKELTPLSINFPNLEYNILGLLFFRIHYLGITTSGFPGFALFAPPPQLLAFRTTGLPLAWVLWLRSPVGDRCC